MCRNIKPDYCYVYRLLHQQTIIIASIISLTSAYMAESLAGIESHLTRCLADQALRRAVITFLLPNQPFPLSVNLLLMFPPLVATTCSLLCCCTHSLPNHCRLSTDYSIAVQCSSFVWCYTFINAAPTGNMFAIIAFL